MSIKQNLQQGFTLLEVMIAFFILGVGLLGLGALSGQSVQINQNAFYRTQAAMIAQDIADRIRANYEDRGVNYIGKSGLKSANCVSNSGYAGGCTPAEMAANDLFDVEQSASQQLPGGQVLVCGDKTPNDGTSVGSAECSGALTDIVIKVFWDGDRDGEPEQRFVMRLW